MRDSSINNVNFLNAGLQSFQGRFDFGDHSGIDHTVANQFPATGGGQMRLQRGRILSIEENARHIAQKHQLFRLNQPSHRCGGSVGIDVQLRPGFIQRNRWQDGNHVFATGHQQQIAIDIRDLSDTSQIDRFAVLARKHQFSADQTIDRLIMQTASVATLACNFVHQPLTDLAAKRFGDNFQGLVIGVPPSLNETRLNSGRRHGGINGLATAMHQDRPHADCRHEDHIGQKRSNRFGLFHRTAAKLDHDVPTPELAHPAQRFHQHIGFMDSLIQILRHRSPRQNSRGKTPDSREAFRKVSISHRNQLNSTATPNAEKRKTSLTQSRKACRELIHDCPTEPPSSS